MEWVFTSTLQYDVSAGECVLPTLLRLLGHLRMTQPPQYSSSMRTTPRYPSHPSTLWRSVRAAVERTRSPIMRIRRTQRPGQSTQQRMRCSADSSRQRPACTRRNGVHLAETFAAILFTVSGPLLTSLP